MKKLVPVSLILICNSTFFPNLYSYLVNNLLADTSEQAYRAEIPDGFETILCKYFIKLLILVTLFNLGMEDER